MKTVWLVRLLNCRFDPEAMSYPEILFPGPVFTGTAKTAEDETIQSTLLKTIERADAKTVTEVDGVSNLPS